MKFQNQVYRKSEGSGNSNQKPNGKNVRLSQVMDNFENDKKLSGRSSKTMEQYEYVFGRFGEFIGKNPFIAEIDKDLIRDYLTFLMDEVKVTTVAIHFRVLRSFFNWSVDEGYLGVSPMRDMSEPKTPKKFPYVLNESQVNQFLESARKRLDSWAGNRNYTIVILLLDVGLRLNEVITAKLQNLDLDHHSIKVHGKGAKDRKVFYGEETGKRLKKWLRVRENIDAKVTSDTIFIDLNGNEIKSRNLQRIITRMQKRADLEDLKISPHVFRHTAATMAIDNGLDVFSLQRMFGWEQLETAMKYVHMSGKRFEEAARKSSPVDSLDESGNRNTGRGDWEKVY